MSMVPVVGALVLAGFAAGEPLLRLAVEERHSIAADERHALFLDAKQRVVVVDLHAARVVALPSARGGGPWRAGCFTADGGALWLLEEAGTAQRFELRQPPQPQQSAPFLPSATVALPAGGGWHDLVAAPDGRSLAWSATRAGQRCAGVVAVTDGRELARFDAVGAAARSHDVLPWIAFVGEGAHVVVCIEPKGDGLRVLGHGDGSLQLWNLAEQRAAAHLHPYVAHRSPGYALLPDGVAFATRSERDFPVLCQRLGEPRPIVLLPDARGGHFTDLFVEPNGEWLCEQDFEDDDGITVIDVVGTRPPRTVAPGRRFVGFGSAPRQEEIPAAGVALAPGVVACGRDGTLERFALLDGSLQQRFTPEAGFTTTAARWCCRVPRLLLVGYHLAADGKSGDFEAQLHSLRPDGK
ncbi:MAG: hypothetical protein JNL90_16490 [Planctomycetes bacterium]|nr:hypothetical protein [Planctomycetota bacterium]